MEMCRGWLSRDLGRDEAPDWDMRTEQEYRSLIAQGLRGDGRYSVDDIVEGLKNGTLQLFEEPEGIIVTQVMQLRDRRLLVFIMAGQNFKLWKERMLKRLVEFATEQECICIEAFCRPGLARILQEDRWKLHQVLMQLPIKRG